MNRLDVYTAVHKMQRARLFALTVEAGKADPGDATLRANLAAAVAELIAELEAHAEHEDRFIHPMLRKYAPGVATRLDEEHVALDATMERLQAIADEYASGPSMRDANALYRALASFTAAYLNHVAVEEAEALPALWADCTDDELMGILVSFKGSRTDIENLTALVAQLATLNPVERERMAAVGFGNYGSREVGELLATLLAPSQLGALRRATGHAATEFHP